MAVLASRFDYRTRPIRSVLVITKHNFMGDTIVATPLLRATRRVFPEAKITLLTGVAAEVALREFPYMDRVITYAPRAQRGAAAAARLVRTLRGDQGAPDICLIADRSFRSAVLAAFCGARVRAGFDTEGRGALLTHRVPWVMDRPETECCLDILRAIAPEESGTPYYDPFPLLAVTAAERERGAQILRDREAIGTKLVGIQPGASYPSKQWGTTRFAEVARGLVADGTGIVLLGGKAEIETARAMREAVGDSAPLVDLTGATDLRETMGVLTQLALFVGNDTGVTHIAASLGIPTVSLFGPTSAQKWGEQGPRNHVLAAPERDLSALETAPVLAAARSLLTAASGEPADTGAATADLVLGAKWR